MRVDWVPGEMAWGLPRGMSKGTVVTALDLWLLLRGRVCPGSLVAGTELVGWHPMWGRGIQRAEAVSLGGLKRALVAKDQQLALW